jgi:surfeit locus 1 family protein
MALASPSDLAPQREKKSRRKTTFVIALISLTLACSGFFALGVWQLYRLQWKLALIERVDSRIHAAPASLPAVTLWPTLSKQNDEYRHVVVEGHFLPLPSRRVKAVTELGPGYWQLSPFQTTDGHILFINRGYAPEEWQTTVVPTETRITGLLRFSEPGGGFLRQNDVKNLRWFSRDVQTLAASYNFNPAQVAPFFIDADAAADSPVISTHDGINLNPQTMHWPQGGLTVVSFPNNHLSYAFTWFALALMCMGALFWLVRDWRQPLTDTAATH